MRLYNITTQKEGSLTIKADSDDEITKAIYTLSEEEVESLIHWEQGCAKFISNYKDIDPSDETTPYDFNAREIILTNIARENIEIAWARFLEEFIAPARNMSDEQKRNLLILIVEREIKEMAQDTDQYQKEEIERLLSRSDYNTKYVYGIQPIPRNEFINKSLINIQKYITEYNIPDAVFTTEPSAIAEYPDKNTMLNELIRLSGYDILYGDKSKIREEDRPIFEKLLASDREEFLYGQIDIQDAIERINNYTANQQKEAASIKTDYSQWDDSEMTEEERLEAIWSIEGKDIPKNDKKEKKNPFKSFFGLEKKTKQ